MSAHAHEEHHETSFYVKIWAILLILLFVSILGPELGMKWVTLFTAFGIAIVKAYMVAVNFMHINLTPRFVIYLVLTSLVFMLLFFSGTAPDVMKASGENWTKPSWVAAAAEYEATGGWKAHHGEAVIQQLEEEVGHEGGPPY
jgi:caa(3)-type oxidase subunit IV